MKKVEDQGKFTEIVQGASPNMKKIATELRKLIADVYPDVVEVPWAKQKIIGYGVGSKKMSEHFCYLGIFKNHVNLGFYYGADLADPNGLLEGTGKKLRHVKISTVEDASQKDIKRLVKSALRERQDTLGI